MQIQCLPSNGAADVQCELCGLAFHVCEPRFAGAMRGYLHACARHALRQQHSRAAQAGRVHPPGVFTLDTLTGMLAQNASGHGTKAMA